MRVFTSLPSPQEALARYRTALDLSPIGTETVLLPEGLGRVLAADVVSAEDLPPFDRSTVDGFAVRAADVASAAEAAPIFLRRVGEVRMGEGTALRLGPGETARVPTGGMLPAGADAVVMQEHTGGPGETVEVRRSVKGGENVLYQGEDVRAGDVVLRAGQRLRPQDTGILAGLGHPRVVVRVRPRAAVLSSGDEIVSPDRPVGAGQVRDMNSFALDGLVRQAGGLTTRFPILPDDFATVAAALREAVAAHDLVLISGGSSVGERDVVADAIQSLGPPGILIHGVALRPGKPTVLAAAGRVPVIGLPGNPVSAMVVFNVFVRPLLRDLLGMTGESPAGRIVRARAARPLGAGEREEHMRVALEARDDDLWARPLPPKSGLLTSMVRADGIVVVPAGRRVAEGEIVEVDLLEG